MFHQIFWKVKHYLKKTTRKDIKSTFLSDLLDATINSPTSFYAFDKINAQRQNLAQNRSLVDEIDFGQKSRLKNKQRTVNSIYKSSSISTKNGELLFKIINHLKSQSIIELGTCLGVSTMYFASPNKQNKVYTFEGNTARSKIARNTFKQLKLQNIELLEGDIDITLSSKIQELETIDFVFFDANHSYEATLKYYELLKPLHNANTLFVFDDIYWSTGMTQAWNEINSDKTNTITISSSSMGFVFFKQNEHKKHYYLKM